MTDQVHDESATPGESATVAPRDRRAEVLAAARHLFETRGYASVTVRDIAAEAGVSPSLVIKHHASKSALFAEVGPPDIPLADLDLPAGDVGRALVGRILDRRDRGEPELWLQLCQNIRESPEPDRTRDQLRSDLVVEVAQLVDDHSVDHRQASMIISLLIGVAAGLRTIALHEDLTRDDLLDLYAPLIQQLVDAAATPAVEAPTTRLS